MRFVLYAVAIIAPLLIAMILFWGPVLALLLGCAAVGLIELAVHIIRWGWT